MAFLALLAAVLVIALSAVAGRRWVCPAAAVLNLAFAGLLTSYVFRTEAAFGGRTAWRQRVDAGEHALYFVTMAVAACSVAVFALLALRRSPAGLRRGALLASGVVDLVLGWTVFIAFELD